MGASAGRGLGSGTSPSSNWRCNVGEPGSGIAECFRAAAGYAASTNTATVALTIPAAPDITRRQDHLRCMFRTLKFITI